MSRNLTLPFFPVPPEEYDYQYFAELVRSYSTYLEQMQNAGEGRNTFMVFTELQTDDSGLELGGVFNHGGFLKVAELNTPHVRGLQGTGQVGFATVTIS